MEHRQKRRFLADSEGVVVKPTRDVVQNAAARALVDAVAARYVLTL